MTEENELTFWATRLDGTLDPIPFSQIAFFQPLKNKQTLIFMKEYEPIITDSFIEEILEGLAPFVLP